MTFGLTPSGFKQKRLHDIVNDLDDAFVGQFGDINTEPQSVFGQIIGIFAKQFADLWENLDAVYYSQYPNSAESISLDNVVGLNGLVRLPATQTQVFASCAGNEGTLVSQNALATIPHSNQVFYAPFGGIITQSNADRVVIAVDDLAAQVYSVVLNATPFIFSLPIITFTGSFVSGNATIVTINGINLPSVPFNTNSSDTIDDIATAIENDPAVLAVNVIGSAIYITPGFGFSVTVNYINIQGGASQPTYAITFDIPASLAEVSSYLEDVINAGTPNWTATDLTGSLEIITTDEEIPFSLSLGSNLSLTSFTSPIQFNCQSFGPIACPVESLTEIATPLAGWESITNLSDGILGTNQETDAELRARRQRSITLLGLATVPAIESHLLAIAGVTAASVFENTTLTQTPIVLTFSAAVVSGQTINVSYNAGTGSFNVPFATSQAVTMANLATAFLAISGVDTAVVSGAGNLVLTVTMEQLSELVVDNGDVTVTGSGTLPICVVTGGRPPKSVECVVEGATNQAVGNEVWRIKPAGIEAFGNTEVEVIDSQGNTQIVFFSRPVSLYISVNVVLTLYSGETFPANGDVAVAEAILAYGDTLGVGQSVLLQRVQAQVFNVPGIASAVVQLGVTVTANASPAFASSDITIDSTQISNFDIERINVTVA